MTLHANPMSAVPQVVLREADIFECLAGGFTPDEALRVSLESSDEAFTLHNSRGDIIALWGYAGETLLGRKARAWMLSTSAADKDKLCSARVSIWTFQWLFEKFDIVEVVAWEKHLLAVRWLRWLGFQTAHKTFYQNGEVFLTMQLHKGDFQWAG